MTGALRNYKMDAVKRAARVEMLTEIMQKYHGGGPRAEMALEHIQAEFLSLLRAVSKLENALAEKSSKSNALAAQVAERDLTIRRMERADAAHRDRYKNLMYIQMDTICGECHHAWGDPDQFSPVERECGEHLCYFCALSRGELPPGEEPR